MYTYAYIIMICAMALEIFVFNYKIPSVNKHPSASSYYTEEIFCVPGPKTINFPWNYYNY